jgi:hypothetical protein
LCIIIQQEVFSAHLFGAERNGKNATTMMARSKKRTPLLELM